MEKHIKHLMDQLDLYIKELDDRKDVLQDLKNKLFSYGYAESSKFKCPLGKSDKDAICPECDSVLPSIDEHWVREEDREIQTRTYPIGMSDIWIEKCKNNKEGCIQWRKKKDPGVCGCGGTATCRCGYLFGFCVLIDTNCPYCGRELNVVYSEMHKQRTLAAMPFSYVKQSPLVEAQEEIEKEEQND